MHAHAVKIQAISHHDASGYQEAAAIFKSRGPRDWPFLDLSGRYRNALAQGSTMPCLHASIQPQRDVFYIPPGWLDYSLGYYMDQLEYVNRDTEIVHSELADATYLLPIDIY